MSGGSGSGGGGSGGSRSCGSSSGGSGSIGSSSSSGTRIHDTTYYLLPITFSLFLQIFRVPMAANFREKYVFISGVAKSDLLEPTPNLKQ